MVKVKSLILACAMSLAVLPSIAGRVKYGLRIPNIPGKHIVKQKVLPSQRVTRMRAFEKNYPALCAVKNKMPETSVLKSQLQRVKPFTPKPMTSIQKSSLLQTTDGRELYGNVVYSAFWDEMKRGLYTFTTGDPIDPESIWLNEDMAANGGGALVNGVFHEINWSESDGYIFITYCSFDATTGEMLSSEGLDDISLIGTDLAVAFDGTVYGEFYNSTATGYELGIIDYSTMTRSTIGSLSKWYVALGITKDNVLYGVASDGNLYKIDAKTAKETLVGATGVSLINSSGSVYGQSGEIDQKTGTFYWAALTGNELSALYTVDLSSGVASRVGEFTGQEQIYALTIPAPAAEDDAPAAVDDVTLSFTGASLTGTVSFTAPTNTFAGGTLSGALTYTIVADNDTLATGTTTAGASVAQSVTVSSSGSHTFIITTANEVGRSPQTKVSQFVGYDETYPVEDLIVKSNSATGKVTLSWSAPTGSYNDGYVGDLKYDVIRYPDGVTIAEGLTATTYTDTPQPDQLTAYTYGVVAINGDMRSGEATSDKVVVGPALVPPYDNDFPDESSLDLMTIIDANGDGCTWGYHPDQNCAYYVYNGENSGDDWLLTPPLSMKAGKEYAVTFTASNTIEEYNEQLEVKYGEGDDPTTFSGTLLESTTLTEKKEFTSYIIPEKDGDVKIAFHALSEPDMFNLLLFGVHVSAGSDVSAPDSISNLTLTPDKQGATSVNVSFNVPNTAIDGSRLTSVTKIEVYRDGTLVKTISDDLEPGSNISFNDFVDTDGIYAYKAITYNENGAGRVSGVKRAFVGTDIPAAVEAKSIVVKDNGSSLNISWNGVTEGKNGGYVNPSTISYNLYDNLSYDAFYGYEYGNHLDSVCGTSQSIISMNTDEGDQNMLTVHIQPQNTKGMGEYSKAMTIVTGAPYTIPFSEPFDNGSISYGLWWYNADGSSSWYLSSDVASVDGDTPGVVVFDGCGDESYFASGKIAPAGATNMKLYFTMRSELSAQATLTVQIQKSDGTVDNLKTYEFDGTEDTTPWQTECISLAKYANERYIIVRFLGNGRGLIPIDNIQVRQVYADDLGATMTAPEKLKKGQTDNVTVKTTNYGENTASNYIVRLLDGDELVESKTISKALAPMASDTVSFNYTPSIFHDGDMAELTADVIYDGDLDESNNKVSATVNLVSSSKPAPNSATVTTGATGSVVEWTAPANDKKEVTDSFEDYNSWTVDNFGDWTCIDGDKGYTGSIFNSYVYDNQGTPYAFIIFDPNDIDSELLNNNPELTPHSGNKYAASMYSVLDDNFVDADNWLISPTLSGEQQTVKFYALNQADSENNYPETIELLYSTGGTDKEEFTLVKTVTIDKGTWEEVTFDVPASATHFAIHHTTEEGGYLLGIDDVTYKVGYGVLTGYNIYRDGQLLGTVDASTLKYTDASNSNESSVYAVTAVYADGESAPTIAYNSTGIENIENTGKTQPFNAYTIDGKLVGEGLTSTKLLLPGIYIINGQKVTVK